MFKRYDLDVFYNSTPIYCGSFSSINLLCKFACGFDFSVCDFIATDVVTEKSVPLVELCNVYKGDINGI